MFIRLLTILMLVIQPILLAAISVDSECGPSTAMSHSSCCCGDMAASCEMLSQAMQCGCFESSEPIVPAPAAPRNQNSQVIALAVIMSTAMTIESATASYPALTSRTIGDYRSNTHKQATLCVWLS